ncbi:hypothetical protein PISMIDRAFT_117530 [Pisolithus microcarpus 441]|uniref:DDE Tnp4 domain-containing protein n=1 Tax=Pisolithus microcarpus 441 TaxID=765257 RepID=A0A0C9YVE8_9AGAM|nr:hypothetical protein PISMIDRAFT_117530 [Pisolithus microcarpus 441]
MIVDYSLGQPGSVHDAYAFRGTRIFQDPTSCLPPRHWIWADSAYPSEMWCAVPFKRLCGGSLTCRQNIYNRYVSKICVRVEHAFAALKGRFQSLHELWLKVTKDEDLHVAIYWIMCCMILHNMITYFVSNRSDEVEESTSWAIREVEGWDENVVDEIREERTGTHGQRFRGLLMERLFEQCGIRV